ncbi:MAG: hypothetical protein LQ345_001757 [Seirophora villosa]|nr:MAG: hypothetical protein LQ345_001757 [Seirophora villosa]
MDSSSLDRHLSSGEEAQLAEALELRRKQLDREIAEFAADKEKEFRKFEKRLRSEKRDTERQKILQCEREVEKANFKRRGSKDQRSAPAEVRNDEVKTADVVFEDSRSNGVRFAGATEIPQESNAGLKRRKAGDDGAAAEGQPVHEHEVEFQGLFTPIYLPLLGGRRKDAAKEVVGEGADGSPHASAVGTPQPDDARLPTTTAAKPVEKPTTSSTAAPTSGSAPLIRAHSHHLSSSDLRKLSMSERRSSSRSDTSVSSLRSSLRDPKQPRSPKRVLFSIDNVVVSPSTSPAMQRKISAAKKSDGIDVVSKLDVADSRGRRGDVGILDPYAWRQYNPGTQLNKSTFTNVPAAHSSRSGDSSSSKTPVHPAAHIGLGRTSPSMGGDGFEHIRGEEDDDLFAFDEDITDRGRNLGDDAEDGGVLDEELDLENVREEDFLPTSSPHAGSLPIEIRWPSRKDPRG